jgi:small subunit ribosomal protein S8
MSIDTIGNFLTVIRNGIMVTKKFVTVPYSKVKHEIAAILEEEGFIKNFAIETSDKGFKTLKVALRYVNNESAIHEITRISSPGLRVYKGFSNVEPVIGGLGITILSTNKGILTNRKAKSLSTGGEVLCTVW